MIDAAYLLTLSILTDFLFADPQYKFHPVRIIGNVILFLETFIKRVGFDSFVGGVLLTLFSNLIIISIIISLYFFSLHFYYPVHFVMIIFLFYSAIGFRSLIKYAKTIHKQLENNNITSASNTLSNIVGRETKNLNKTEIIRATIESVAENFVDGILSPIFWFVVGCIIGNYFGHEILFGIGFVYLYRTTNTLDSMVGYKNETYEQFGKASARFDDVLNFIPARVSVLIITLSSLLIGLDAKSSLAIASRDRLKHKSPNAGHPESATAGALNVKLGGPVSYPFGVVEKEWLGKEFSDPTSNNLSKVIKLVNTSVIISTVLGVMFLLTLN